MKPNACRGKQRYGRIVGAFALATLVLPNAHAARNTLGVFGGWGAFRDDAPLRCFAIAEPTRPGSSRSRSFVSIATWPAQRVHGQLHIRLARERGATFPATLTIGAQRFALVGAGVDLWAPDSRSDAAIVAAIRTASSLRIETRSTSGRAFAETYLLKGAATAIDAAAIACAQ